MGGCWGAVGSLLFIGPTEIAAGCVLVVRLDQVPWSHGGSVGSGFELLSEGWKREGGSGGRSVDGGARGRTGGAEAPLSSI